jgi:hypothetical protein
MEEEMRSLLPVVDDDGDEQSAMLWLRDAVDGQMEAVTMEAVCVRLTAMETINVAIKRNLFAVIRICNSLGLLIPLLLINCEYFSVEYWPSSSLLCVIAGHGHDRRRRSARCI